MPPIDIDAARRADDDAPAPARRRRWVPDALGLGWLVLVIGGVMAPALAHGASLGGYDWLSQFGLSARPGTTIHDVLAGDQITQMIPWTHLAWTQVHAGHLPLWNPYSALGMPLAFNWQSAAFSLPTVVGYAFPLHLAYTAGIFTTMAVAGVGAYFLTRVLGAGAIGAAFAATTFTLSGAFMFHLGWPIASVMSWAGWIAAFVVLVVRHGARPRLVVPLAVTVAMAVYAGQPDALVILAVGVAVLTVVFLAGRYRACRDVRDVTTRLVGIGLGAAAGAALSAPLLLPGAAVLRQSIRSLGGGASGGRNAIAVMDLTHSTVAGVNGPWYLGVISIVLAVVAVAFRWRSIETVALVVLAAVMAGLAFAQPIISVLASTPGLEAVRWPRAVILVALPLSVLAGLGVQDVTGARDLADVRRWLGWGFGAAGAVVVVLLLTGSSKVSTSTEGTLGLAWPAISVAAGLSTVAYLALPDRGRTGDPVPGLLRRRRVRAAVALVAVQSVFLVAAGAPLWPSSPDYFAPTSGELALHRAVGDALVGLGSSDCYLPPALGIRPNANLFVGVQQLAVYDPMLPSAYYRSWRTITGQSPDSAGFPAVSTYCPPITSVAIARAYGVGYVLEPRGTTGPAGTVLAARVADEDVYRVPGAATVTATPTDDPNGATTALPVGRPGPASMSFTTHGSTPLRLVIRVTSTPGWHATIDGRALALAPYEGVMLQASVPAGTHVVAMHYAPTTFTAGVALATVVLVAAAVWLVVGEHLLPRRRRASPDGPGSDGPAAATAPPPP